MDRIKYAMIIPSKARLTENAVKKVNILQDIALKNLNTIESISFNL